MRNYLSNWPGGHRFITEILLFGGGGSSGGTSSTVANMKPWAGYVPPETYKTYKEYLPKIASRYDTGLSPEERAQYTGEVLSTTGQQFAGAEKELTENLARSGVKGGARAEALSDLGRSKAITTTMGLSGLTAKDIEEKKAARDELRRWIGLPSSPVQVGSTTTTSPSGGGGS